MPPHIHVWILGSRIDQTLFELAGDARRTADRLHSAVGVCVIGVEADQAEQLVAHGVDLVCCVDTALGPRSSAATAAAILTPHEVRVVFAPGDCQGREWAALLAVRLGWTLVSPALLVQVRAPGLEVTGLDRSGRLARQMHLDRHEAVIVTMRAGVAEALPARPDRAGQLVHVPAIYQPEGVTPLEILAADPSSVDIRYVDRLVAGGRGLGSQAGFDLLRRFAKKLRAGVAASRMAVDLGWIERERQVGQSGKTVTPQLYIACGISGASHHLEGMSGAEHIVAINTDPQAAIFQIAHLGLVADLYEVLACAEEELTG